MKSLILYGSKEKLTSAHKLVTHPLQPAFYVRADMVHMDVGEALAKAKPQDGESVINSVAIEE